MESSKKLKRYIAKAFGSEAALGEALSNEASLESLKIVISKLPDFLHLIDASLEQSEKRAALANKSLELSSKELFDANTHLQTMNRNVKSIMDNLGQAILVFDETGSCLPIHSRSCAVILEGEPTGKSIVDVLKLSAKDREYFPDWIELLFREAICFEDLADLMPKIYPHSSGRFITTEFKPIRSDDGKIMHVLVVATDRSEERAQEERIKEKNTFSEKIISLISNREGFWSFCKLLTEVCDKINQISPSSQTSESLTSLVRGLHNMKSTAGSFSIHSLRDLIHQFESELKENPEAFLSRRREKTTVILQTLFEHTREMESIFGNDFIHQSKYRNVKIEDIQGFQEELLKDSASASLVKKYEEMIVTVPLKGQLARFSSLVNEAATTLGKKVSPLKIEVDELIKIRQEMYEGLLSAFSHVFTNAVDHGIESPDARLLFNKPESGLIILKAQRLFMNGKSFIELTVEDDGAGIQDSTIIEILAKRGFSKESALALPRRDFYNSMFTSGISTKQSVTVYSGRGVGLTALKSEVDKLEGTIDFTTTPGAGSKIKIVIPELSSIGLATLKVA